MLHLRYILNQNCTLGTNMNKMLYLQLLLVIISCTNYSVDPEEIEIYNSRVMMNDSLKAVLYSDAQNLAIEQMQKDERIYYTNPWLDEEDVQKYYKDFITIYTTLTNSNTNFGKYNRYMHFPDSKYLTQGLMAVDTSKTWAQSWLNGKQESGIESIDAIIKQFNLKVEIRQSWSSSKYDFFLLAHKPMNLNVPIQQLKKTNEFIYVDRNYAHSIIPNPKLLKDGSSRTYLFTYGWGDCFCGCIFKHYWQVTVNNKTIIDIYEYGDPIGYEQYF